MSFKKRSIIIRLWWRLINPVIRNRPTKLEGEDDYKKLMEESNGTKEIYDNREQT